MGGRLKLTFNSHKDLGHATAADPKLKVSDPKLQVSDPSLEVSDPKLEVSDPKIQVWILHVQDLIRNFERQAQRW